jgi:hypothetical protein
LAVRRIKHAHHEHHHYREGSFHTQTSRLELPAIDIEDSVHAAFSKIGFTPLSLPKNKKTGTDNSVAGFTIRSLMPVVTTLGNQFIASTNAQSSTAFSAQCMPGAKMSQWRES